MITVKYRGGLGNNMFQRGIAEIFAQESGLAVDDSSSPRQLKSIIHPTIGENNSGNPMVINDDILYGHTNFLKRLYDKNERLEFEGFFQRSWLYLDYRDFLKGFFSMALDNRAAEREGVAVCIRRGNVTGSVYHIPIEYYEYVINRNCLKDSLYIFTDSPYDKDVECLVNKYGAVVVSGDAVKDMSYISKFSKIIAGSSSYHWWSVFLSSAEEIYFPLHNGGWGFTPSQKPSIDLYLPFVNYIHYSKYMEVSK